MAGNGGGVSHRTRQKRAQVNQTLDLVKPCNVGQSSHASRPLHTCFALHLSLRPSLPPAVPPALCPAPYTAPTQSAWRHGAWRSRWRVLASLPLCPLPCPLPSMPPALRLPDRVTHPISMAAWCVEKHVAVSTTMEVSERSPVLIRWWWQAPTAARAGMGVRSELIAAVSWRGNGGGVGGGESQHRCRVQCCAIMLASSGPSLHVMH